MSITAAGKSNVFNYLCPRIFSQTSPNNKSNNANNKNIIVVIVVQLLSLLFDKKMLSASA